MTESEGKPVSTERKSTGIEAHNGMMHVGDLVLYEDGWLCFTERIVEYNGKFGFIMGGEFTELSDFIYFPDEDPPGIDFEILSEEQKEE